jgi:hypothetical protein
MFAKCSNPDCGVPFDYREGRLIRFCRSQTDGQFHANDHCVEHFWLCASCSKFYAFDFERGTGTKSKLLLRDLREEAPRSFAMAVSGREPIQAN